MGGLRASAQMISYELGLGLSLIGVILLAGTLDLGRIVELQSGWHGARWFIFFHPLGFIVYLIAAIAETNRVPFDLPEAETELVAGFHTEYSAMKFALFFLAEYINMFTVSMLATTLFLGGWNVPFADVIFGRGSFLFGLVSVIGFLVKIVFFLFLYIWIRGTLPRFRFDQLMNFGWKVLLPLALLSIFITATLIVCVSEIFDADSPLSAFCGNGCGVRARIGDAAQPALQRNLADRGLHLAGVPLRDARGALHRCRAGDCLRGRDHGARCVRYHAAQRRAGGTAKRASEVSRAGCCCTRRDFDRRSRFHTRYSAGLPRHSCVRRFERRTHSLNRLSIVYAVPFAV